MLLTVDNSGSRLCFGENSLPVVKEQQHPDLADEAGRYSRGLRDAGL